MCIVGKTEIGSRLFAESTYYIATQPSEAVVARRSKTTKRSVHLLVIYLSVLKENLIFFKFQTSEAFEFEERGNGAVELCRYFGTGR